MKKLSDVWGESLYKLAAEENVSDQMLKDLELVLVLFRENPDYVRILDEPSVSKEERVKLLDDAFRGKIQAYLLNFLKILCENNAVSQLPGCERCFRRNYYADNNIAEAVVTSARGLSPEQLDALKRKLESVSSKTIIMKEKIDERLIAGVQVELDGKLYDGSASGRIDEIRKSVNGIKL